MGPPQNVFGNIVDPTRASRMDKKKFYIKKYENETRRKIKAEPEYSPDIPRCENSTGLSTEEDLRNERVRFTHERAHSEVDPRTMYCHMMYNPQIKDETSEPHMFDLYNSQLTLQSQEPQMYNFIKQESYHDAVPHAHRLNSSIPSSYHNDSRNDYSNYPSINSIPFSSLNLSGDKNYFSPVHNSEPEGQLMNFTNNDIDTYCPNPDFYQSGHLAQSDVKDDFSLSRSDSYDRHSEDAKPDSYDSFAYDEDYYGGYEVEQPLDLTMRRSYLTVPNEEDDEDALSKQSSEAGSPFYPPDEETDDETKNLLRKIKTGTRSRVRSPKSWEFLLRMLLDERFNPRLIRWEDKKIGSFRLVKKDEIAKIWGMRSVKHKDGGLTYDNFARNLRYHYKTKMLLPVSEKHLVYQFGDEIMDQLKTTGTYAFT